LQKPPKQFRASGLNLATNEIVLEKCAGREKKMEIKEMANIKKTK